MSTADPTRALAGQGEDASGDSGKARDRTGRQIKRRPGPVADWTPKQARDDCKAAVSGVGPR